MGRASRSKRGRRGFVEAAGGGPELIDAELLDDPRELPLLVGRLTSQVGEAGAVRAIGAAQALRVGVELDDQDDDEHELREEMPLAWFGGPGGTFEIGRDGQVRPSGWRTA